MSRALGIGKTSAWTVALATATLLVVVTTLALNGCQPHTTAPSASAIPKLRAVSSAEAAEFVGSESCAGCHPKQSESHADSHHAHALTAVTASSHGDRFRDRSNVHDPDRDLRYQTTVAGDECVLTVTEHGQTTGIAARYGFGSGKHAITYLGDFNHQLLELRLSHYTAARRWEFSPGQQLKEISGGVLYPHGLVKAPGVVEECFVCHSTTVVKDEQGIRPDRSRFGVGCEACHGGGRAHVAAAQAGARDLKMAQLSTLRPRLTVELCGQCHRSPAGEDISDPFNRSQMPRLQGLALSQSACFTNSGGRLSCLTCHDPHGDAKATRLHYNRQCGSCHDGATPDKQACTVEPQGDCVSCHMPEQSVGMPTGLKYRTHWIKVWGVR